MGKPSKSKKAADTEMADVSTEVPAHLESLRTHTRVGADMQTGCHPMSHASTMGAMGTDNVSPHASVPMRQSVTGEKETSPTTAARAKATTLSGPEAPWAEREGR